LCSATDAESLASKKDTYVRIQITGLNYMYAVFWIAKVVLDCDLDRLEFGFFVALGYRVWGSSACID